MAIIGEWIRRLGYLLRRRAREDELRREMEAHRAQMEEPRAFGNTLRLREEARDAWGWSWLDDLVQDTRFAWRTLRHSPGFALTAIVTLALGIGVNIGMFSLVNGLLLRPLYERPDEVVSIYGRSTAPDGGIRGISYPNYLDLQEGTTDVFANLAASSTVFVGLDAGDGPRRTMASAVTANYFQVFGTPWRLDAPSPRKKNGPARIPRGDHQLSRSGSSAAQTRACSAGSCASTANSSRSSGSRPRDSRGRASPDQKSGCRSARTTTFAASAPADSPFGAREAHELSVVGRLRPDASIEICRSGARHRWPSTRAGISVGQRRLHAADCSAFTSHVHARSGERRVHRDARPAPDGHAGDRPARGVPQPRRSAAGARSRAPAGTGHQVVTRWRPMAPHSATAHRRIAPRVGRRRGRVAAVDVGDRGAAGVAASRAPRRR